ncbi:hypothetical protein [Spirillospora albida]|uniref:hypothetical protein n=1 Tax=Spirillospora albida TaxID=58123 RepID=UPI000A0429DD|nr:hypothetical protein [Spirillospora albida]
MNNEVEWESAGTLRGQLQRGLGRAARRAADTPGAGEYVYDCVRSDPRRDPRCEARSLYYARLMVDLELPTGPVAEHLFDPAGEPGLPSGATPRDDARDAGADEGRVRLALDVLADLVRLSRREAAVPLRRYAEDGEHWFAAVETLVALGDPGLAAGLDAVVADRCDEAELDMLLTGPPGPVIEAWAASRPRIAAALARRLDPERTRRPVPASVRRPERTDDELLDLARGRDAGAVAAIFELGRRRAPALLDLAEELLRQRPSRAGGAVCRALGDYGPESLPRARAWAAEGGGCAGLGLRIVARHGTRQDIPLLMDELRGAVERRDWTGAASPVEGLGRLRAGEAVDLLKTAWTETTYAFLRPRVLTALARTAPHTAEAHTVEALWDCEEKARQEAARLAPLTRDTRTRLRRLELDAAEDPAVRAIAAARLL